MQNNFWINKWEVNQIGFHQDDIHKYLKNYWKKFIQDFNITGKTVFVPLCGKSLDMIFLKDNGFHVIGCELSEIACQSFFQENEIEYTVHEITNFKLFKSQSIELYCGDILNLTQLSPIDIIYDRASIIALSDTLRANYISKIKELDADFQFIITLEFDNKEVGPPFSVSMENINNYYSDRYKVTKTVSQELPIEVHKDHLKSLHENLFILNRGI